MIRLRNRGDKGMKRLVILLVSLVLINQVFAADIAKLRVSLEGPIKTNTNFLCSKQTGCVSLYASSKGKVFPIEAGKIDGLFTMNFANRMIHAESTPASCKVEVKKNQTLTVTGQLVKTTNKNIYINNLNCSVA